MSEQASAPLNDELFQLLKSKDPTGLGTFPPPAFNIVASQFLEYKKGEHLKIRFPIMESYNNPFHVTFGGLYGMFFDQTFGPFSGLESQGPTSSLDMNISFLKAVTPRDDYVDVTATITSNTKSFFIVKGEMHNKAGHLVATCTSRMFILDTKRMSSLKK